MNGNYWKKVLTKNLALWCQIPELCMANIHLKYLAKTRVTQEVLLCGQKKDVNH